MKNSVLLCSIFLTSSVHACWLYDYWFSGSKNTKPEFSEEIQTTRSAIVTSKSSSSNQPSPYVKSEDYYTTRSQNQAFSSSVSKQYLPADTLEQKIRTTGSNEATSNENDSTYDDEASTISFEQPDSAKPDLNCIIFNDSVCSITCNQVCLLYNFESTGVCTKHSTCYCTVIGMKSPAMTLDQYENQSLDDLWYYKFVKSDASAKILDQIKKYPTMSAKVSDMLRKPLRTGDDVKNRLATAYPNWTLLRNLKSRRIAPINRFINDKYKLNEFGLEKRIKRLARKYKDHIVKQFSSIDYIEKLTTFLDTLSDKNDFKNIFKQIHDTNEESLIEYMDSYLQRRGLDLSTEDLESEECDCVDVDYIDNIVAGTIIQQFLAIISTYRELSNSETKASNQSAEMGDPRQVSDNDAEVINQDSNNGNSIIDKNSADDGSRWELPGFGIKMLKDSYGSIDEVWETADYYLRYRKWYSGSIELEWRKVSDKVKIYVYSSGSIDQEWYLNDATIKLSRASSGSIDQSWELGDVSYTYRKWSSGSTERKWKNNCSNQDILATYQGYIMSWCTKNYFLIQMKHCVIY